jgi:hypothetical protein
MEETFPDIGSLSDDELKDLIEELSEEEQQVSYRRRLLHGKIDILRAELVIRMRQRRESGDAMVSGEDIDQLVKILAGRAPATSRDDSAA